MGAETDIGGNVGGFFLGVGERPLKKTEIHGHDNMLLYLIPGFLFFIEKSQILIGFFSFLALGGFSHWFLRDFL